MPLRHVLPRFRLFWQGHARFSTSRTILSAFPPWPYTLLRKDPMHAPLSDWQLLDHFAQSGDEAAFKVLVERHIDLVYGTARRSLGTGHPQLDDAVQAAFLLLARKAATLPRRAALAGWLFRVTRYCCAN